MAHLAGSSPPEAPHCCQASTTLALSFFDLCKKSRELDHKNPQSNSQKHLGTEGSHGKDSQTNSQGVNCGEVMTSIRYCNAHQGPTEQFRKKNPKPVVVARKVGAIREPYEKERTLDGEGACGHS
ncbi:hypothetical protein BDV40DRAFT_302695 [Aspergillus tamarii]|uniref:Uncharacterized protein n=1 Tax=Aspergillus tamarii TaxID=41984 RepID=A0A5N6UN28_ASPTM|nr:hypothetical protein BDV40DRAFT_302695 [Aspergillus tamarii]